VEVREFISNPYTGLSALSRCGSEFLKHKFLDIKMDMDSETYSDSRRYVHIFIYASIIPEDLHFNIYDKRLKTYVHIPVCGLIWHCTLHGSSDLQSTSSWPGGRNELT
jgi:hypothetical protein